MNLESEEYGVQLSTLCPITLTRINNPIRSEKCTHLSCFDLFHWLQSYTNVPTHENLTCPICGIYCNVKNIQFDVLMASILKDAPINAEIVQVDREGMFHVIRSTNPDIYPDD